ncbi:bifunctional UDP-sugar hydrolase/5'-nucleotidase [Desulfobotulus sp.]|uniref:bifunctional metallophosphatase/5'-nucleotidase n=1 Tax=Desulfobotulus sp. TaxID=1940337 RepID=UPI002A35FB50|nr:bifunctional UDP-sugar hydrolase/5'-nucleotidase [Desulfobotulus sp.]MDY0162487.1 bifunctional UDP-sugar hydrolase/5'-nucleotidase [Desulfobotulus sp.]
MQRKIFVLWRVLAVVFFLSTGLWAGEIRELIVLHTNDMHGRVLPGDADGMGLSRLSTLVRDIRAQHAHVLLLDAGDALHGMPIVTLEKGATMVTLMNAMGYGAMTTGNHEFNYGAKRVLELAAMTDFPILAANVKKEDGSLLLQEYVLKNYDGLRVAVFGIATPETLTKAHPDGVKGLRFEDPVATAQRMVDTLKKEADILIALVHLGLDVGTRPEYRSSAIAENVTGIHLIVDGHSHDRLEHGLRVKDTLIVSAHEYNKALGKVVMRLDGEGNVSVDALLISRETGMAAPEDPELKVLIDAIVAKQEAALSEVIGRTSIRLDGDREQIRVGETNLGNLVADAVLEASGAELVFINAGSMRTSVEPGDITLRNLIEILPFGNNIVVKKITGKTLKEVLETGAAVFPRSDGSLLHVAGMVYAIDPSKPKGSRVHDVLIAGKPLDPEKNYLAATNDFLAAGGSEMTMLKDLPTTREAGAVDAALEAYVRKRGLIHPVVEGRIAEKAVEEKARKPEACFLDSLSLFFRTFSPASARTAVP